MATHQYSAFLNHTTNTGFRAWGLAFTTALADSSLGGGLVKTSDTGQIDWTTVTRGGQNITDGYEIWRLANSALYFKFEFGTGNGSTSQPQMWITVGTGSNGSGTLTGQLSTRATWCHNGVAASTSTNYTTYICVLADVIAICFCANSVSSTSNMGTLIISRTHDSTHTVTSEGYGVIRQVSTTSISAQGVRTASVASTGTDSTFFCTNVGASTGLDSNSDIRVFIPYIECKSNAVANFAACGYVAATWAELSTKVITLFGSTSHTYLSLGNQGGVNDNASGMSLAMIWE